MLCWELWQPRGCRSAPDHLSPEPILTPLRVSHRPYFQFPSRGAPGKGFGLGRGGRHLSEGHEHLGQGLGKDLPTCSWWNVNFAPILPAHLLPAPGWFSLWKPCLSPTLFFQFLDRVSLDKIPEAPVKPLPSLRGFVDKWLQPPPPLV